jgi:succinyl-CoA synthetase beta subunit
VDLLKSVSYSIVLLFGILLTRTKYGVGVPPGYVAFSPEEAESVAKKLSMILPYKHHVKKITKLGRK